MKAVYFAVLTVLALIPTAYAQTDLSSEGRIELGVALSEIRGHFWALERNMDDRAPMIEPAQEQVAVHASHPFIEVYPNIERMLGDADVVKEMGEALEIVYVFGQGDSSDLLRNAVDAANDRINRVEEAYLGGAFFLDADFGASVIVPLIAESAAEYDEAILDGNIEFVVELQDAYAFLYIADKEIFSKTSDLYNESQARELERIFVEIQEVFDSRANPDRATALAQEVSTVLGIEISEDDEMHETRTLSDDEKQQALEYTANIRMLLGEAKAMYATNSTHTLELVKEAYIDNYEYIEDTLDAAGASELNEELEHLLRDELTAAIRAEDPAVPAMIDDAISGILVAEQEVPEFGAVAALILVAAIASTIVVASRSRSIFVMR